MGGQGSGRPPKVENLLRPAKFAPVTDDFQLPNLSGVKEEARKTSDVDLTPTLDDSYDNETAAGQPTRTITIDDGAVKFDCNQETAGDFIINTKQTPETGAFRIQVGGSDVFKVHPDATHADNVASVGWIPFADATYDLGRAAGGGPITELRWRDLYLSGEIKGQGSGFPLPEISVDASTGIIEASIEVKGPNVTSGDEPGHTHSTISGITNLDGGGSDGDYTAVNISPLDGGDATT
jgi:hypothetical protein